MPFPTPEDLPDPGIKPTCLASPALAGRFFTTAPPGKPLLLNCWLDSSVKKGTGWGGDFLLGHKVCGLLAPLAENTPAPPTLEAKS